MKKLTDKQKFRLWEPQRNRNSQASRRLEDVEMPLVTLATAGALARLEALRRHYEWQIRRRARSVSLSRP